MARTKHVFDLRDYYDLDETVERLSKNAGREISRDYPRLLVRKGLIRSVDVGSRGKLYLKEDVNHYTVSAVRGRKTKKELVTA